MNTRIHAVLPLALLISVTAAGSGTPSPRLLPDRVQTMVKDQVKSGSYPSVVIGMIDGDHDEVTAFGTLSDGASRPPDAATVYEIGSITKTFTALLLADAVTRNEVSLTDPVHRLLPDVSIPKRGQRTITLLDLATQSSGLPRLPGNLNIQDIADPYARYSLDDLKTFLAGYQLPREPGSRYEYSNLGFGLLGHALAARAKTTYGALVHERITGPLHMEDTSVVSSESMAARFATGHDPAGSATPPWNLGVFAGAGALRSTVHDLLIYLRSAMRPDGTTMGKAMTLATTPQRATDRDSSRIGLAWQIERRKGATVVWHDGMTGGYASFIGFVREDNADTAHATRGVVVLTNIQRDAGSIGMAALLPTTLPAEVKIPGRELAAYEGRYRLAPGFDLNITLSGDQLNVQATGQPMFPLFARTRDEFFLKVVDASLSFHRGKSGAVDSVTLHQNGHDSPAPRVGDAIPPAPPRTAIRMDAASLAGYPGHYPLSPAFALEVTLEGEQLYVQATAQPRIPVYASAKDEFFYKVVDAQLTFERDTAGAVIALVLHQNGQNLRGPKK